MFYAGKLEDHLHIRIIGKLFTLTQRVQKQEEAITNLRQEVKELNRKVDRLTEIAPPSKDADIQAALDAIRSEFPSVTDFEREFSSLCFALATGVGKTRLMGAFISYLHLAHGFNNFFVLAPNLTIYKKLIDDFSKKPK